MSVRKIGVTMRPLDPDSLAEFATAHPVPGERSLKPARLTHLRKLITKGQFLGVEWHRGRCLADDLTYRFDGQHTVHLLQQLLANPEPEVPFPTGAPITLTEWEFDSISEDAAQIFDSFNNPVSVRSNIDILQGYQAPHVELNNLDPNFLMKVLHGITFHEKQAHDELAKRYQAKGLAVPRFNQLPTRLIGVRFKEPQVRTFILWLNEFQQRLMDRPTATRLFRLCINRSGIVAQMHNDWLEVPVVAERFWTMVLTESAPDQDDETRVFADQLKRMDNASKRITAREFYRAALTAWKRYKRSLADTSATTDAVTMPVVTDNPPTTTGDQANA